MSEAWRTTVRCYFYERTPAPGGHTYKILHPHTPQPGLLVLPQPPAVGDRVTLPGDPQPYRVVDRVWNYPAWGSGAWPLVDLEPQDGPLVDLIVECANGPFIDEVEVVTG